MLHGSNYFDNKTRLFSHCTKDFLLFTNPKGRRRIMNTVPRINAEDQHNLDHANYANAAADLLVLSFRLEFSVSNGNRFNPRFPRLFHDFLSGASGVK